MEKHTCKLCFRSFSNGRALGGHMRSHVTPLPPSPHKAPAAEEEAQIEKESASSSSASEEAEEEEGVEGMEEDEGKSPYYGLRENPKKSFRLVDPEFVDAAGFVVQDRESETESSRKNPIRRHRRSKRQRRSVDGPSELSPKFKPKWKLEPEPEPEPEPLSSVSDTTPEEDVALCLMMLSRDIWMRDVSDNDSEEENYEEDRRAGEAEDEEEDEEEEEAEELKFRRRRRSKYQCETCKKVFRSYQALGGHRASHKKIRGCSTPNVPSPPPPATNGRDSIPNNVGSADQHRIHQCPVCLRVFRSGQALGGHKRSHVTGSASATASVSVSVSGSASFVDAAPPPTPAAKLADNFIDLNLPAPVDDDDVMSVVSDAEFVDIPK